MLPVDSNNAGDWVTLARFLSGEDVIGTAGQTTAERAQSIKALWLRLRTRFPCEFRITTEGIAGWHETQARESELDHQWSAAAFRLERLQMLRPTDAPLPVRLVNARSPAKGGN
jgi:hypothetical protein